MNAFASILANARRDHRPLLMGVLNVTPDSFSDGGRYLDNQAWHSRVDALIEEGADVIDVGGESTRPGAEAVSSEEQKRRVLPVIRYAARKRGACVSIDATHPEVVASALEAGACLVNDVSCLADIQLAKMARDADAFLLVMHSAGSMTTMRGFSDHSAEAYVDVVADVAIALRKAGERAENAGLSSDRLLVDPGLGFHKNAEQSYALLGRLTTLTALGWPLVVGPSRKSFLARDVDAPPADRLGGTIAACLAAVQQGAVVLRVHDVRAVRQALAVTAVLAAKGREGAGHGLP